GSFRNSVFPSRSIYALGTFICVCRERQAPNKYELVINLKTAEALGLTVSPDASRPRRRGDRMKKAAEVGFKIELPRRTFLEMAAGPAALPAVSRFAWAQSYPNRPVRIVVGLTAGSASDIVARLLGQWLSEHLGQQFVVENRPGAGTNIAAEAVVRSVPDGYTLLLAASPNAINASLYDKLSFNFIRDIAPVAAISHEPNVVVLNPSLPTRTVPEFIAYAKANPGRINMASAGNGTTSHLAGELFKMMTGVNMVHVPYRGG